MDFIIWVRYSEGSLFQKSLFPVTLTPASPTPNPNPKSNPSIVARICTMDFRNSGPSKLRAGNDFVMDF